MRNELYVYEEKKIGKYIVKVVQDDYPQSPRDWDNLGTMVCFHRRYNLGDDHSFTDSQDEDLVALLKRKDVYWLPLYLYDHSGITINTTGFSCPWDSGQIGIIYVSKEKVKQDFNVKRISAKLKKRVYEILRSEVKVYDQYLTGDVYGFIVGDAHDDHIESCWGFFGDSEYCLKEGIAVAQACIRHDIKKHVEQVKRWIRNRVPLEIRKPMEV